MAWFRLLYLEDRCEPWQVYFMALCDGLKPDEFRDACGRLAVPGRLAVRLCSQRHLVFTTMKAIKRSLKRSAEIRNSQLFAWFGDFTLEVLLYLAARASSEEVRRFVSLYLTRLRTVVPLLGGDDLRGLGLEPGPMLGQIKERLQQARLDGEVSSREEEEALVRSLVLVRSDRNNAS